MQEMIVITKISCYF